MRIFYPILLAALLAAVPRLLRAQACPQAPATCPDLREDPGSSDDSVARLQNPVLPCEVAMENRLRKWAGGIVDNIARKEGWDAAEIYEALGDGFRDDNDSVLVYERRPAHWVHMVWQFVVDKDSLRAWHDWLLEFRQRRLDQGRQYKARLDDKAGAVQVYMDSANYWSTQMSKYMNDHIAQYQKDLLAGSKAGVANYQKGLDMYRRKQDFFINKAADLQKDPQGEKDVSDADKESNEQRLRFHDASVVVLEFDFNDRMAETVGSKRVASPPGASRTGASGPRQAPGANPPGRGGAASPLVTKWYNIAEPDLLDNVNYYTHSHNMALCLIGRWATQADSYGNYKAVWAADITNWRTLTIKKIKSDKIQNMYVRVSGNAAAMKRVLTYLPIDEMVSLITR